MQHLLKTKEPKFTLMFNGLCNTELRPCTDRKFFTGDTVHLAAYSSTDGYTGHYIEGTITFVLFHADAFYIPEGFCLFGLTDMFNRYDADLPENNPKKGTESNPYSKNIL